MRKPGVKGIHEFLRRSKRKCHRVNRKGRIMGRQRLVHLKTAAIILD